MHQKTVGSATYWKFCSRVFYIFMRVKSTVRALIKLRVPLIVSTACPRSGNLFRCITLQMSLLTKIYEEFVVCKIRLKYTPRTISQIIVINISSDLSWIHLHVNYYCLFSHNAIKQILLLLFTFSQTRFGILD